jgi:glycosyltransferase involved in cell wall biosynthesis
MDRPEMLRRCLESILANDHPGFEVICIDQSAQTFDAIQDPRLAVICSSASGKSAALNEGMSHASGRYFAFTDDDCTVPQDWLTEGETLLEAKPDVDLVFGALAAIDHDLSESYVPAFTPSRQEVVFSRWQARLRGGAGANMFARRELFSRIGGFDEAIGPGARFRSCEEFDLYYRALRSNVKVLRDPDNGVLHWGMRVYADGSAQRLLRGYFYGEGAVLAKHVRLGDLAAMWVSIRIFGDHVRMAGGSLLHGKRTGVSLLAFWMSGFARRLITRSERTKPFNFVRKPIA